MALFGYFAVVLIGLLCVAWMCKLDDAQAKDCYEDFLEQRISILESENLELKRKLGEKK
jgi:hypothetical protein